mgnify:CR=1 FL=1
MIYRLLSTLPFWLLYAVAWFGYLLLYYVARYRRQVVHNNLSQAFPEKGEQQIKALSRQFYRRLVQVALEIVKSRRMQPEDFLERAKVLNPEVLEKASNGFKDSVIVVSIHQANWEWMLHGATIGLNIPIDPVYKPLHNKAVDKLILDIRSQFGSRPLTMEKSTRDILRRRREFRLFVMLADQAPTRHERGYWTEFMNQEAAFYLGAESLAKATGFAVVFAQCHRRRTGYYEIEFKELAQPPYDKNKEEHSITDRYVELAQKAILSDPESWLWSNRRWKRDREAEEASERAEPEMENISG